MNKRIGNSEVAFLVGKLSMEGVKENGEYLVETGVEKELFSTNTFFQHKMIHRYTWGRGVEMGEQMSLSDYIAVKENLRKDVLNTKAVKGMFEGSDRNVVLGLIKENSRWEYVRKTGKGMVNKVFC